MAPPKSASKKYPPRPPRRVITFGRYVPDLYVLCENCVFEVRQETLDKASEEWKFVIEHMEKQNALGHIWLVCDQARDIDCLFQFLHTGDYKARSFASHQSTMKSTDSEKITSSGAPVNSGSCHEFHLHVDIFCIAKKYRVNPLKELAWKKFKRCIESNPDIPDLLHAAAAIYKHTKVPVPPLEKVVYRLIVKNLDVIWNTPEHRAELYNIPPLLMMLVVFGEFSLHRPDPSLPRFSDFMAYAKAKALAITGGEKDCDEAICEDTARKAPPKSAK